MTAPTIALQSSPSSAWCFTCKYSIYQQRMPRLPLHNTSHQSASCSHLKLVLVLTRFLAAHTNKHPLHNWTAFYTYQSTHIARSTRHEHQCAATKSAYSLAVSATATRTLVLAREPSSEVHAAAPALRQMTQTRPWPKSLLHNLHLVTCC